MKGHNKPPVKKHTASYKVKQINMILDRADLTSAQKLVAIALTATADREGIATLGSAEIAAKAHLRRSTVMVAIKALSSDGVNLISKLHENGQRGRYNVLTPHVIEQITEACRDIKTSSLNRTGSAKSSTPKRTGRGISNGQVEEKPGAHFGQVPSASNVPGASNGQVSRARISKTSKVSNNNIYNNNYNNNPPRVPARDPSWAQIMADERGETPENTGVALQNETVVLMNGTRQKWVEMFDGDDKRLDLALIEISAELQPNSGKPLHIDVESRLAKRAAWKRDGDKRYQRRTEPKTKSKNSKPAKKPTAEQMRIWAGAEK